MRVVAVAAVVAGAWGGPAVAATVTPVGQLRPTVGNESLFVASTSGGEILATGARTGFVFTQPPAGWGSETAAAQLVGPGEGGVASGAISGSLAVLGYGGQIGAGIGEVFVEPPNGWQGVLEPSARLQDSDGDGIYPHAISEGNVFADAASATKPYDVIDVFTAQSDAWHGAITQSARLEDARGWRTTLASVHGPTAVAEVSDDHGHAGFDVFVKPSSGWSGILHEAARLDVAAVPSGRAPRGTAVITVDNRVFARPPSGWHGTIKPVAALFPQDTPYDPGPTLGAQFAGTRAFLQATPFGYPTHPDPVVTDYWFFDPPARGWSRTVAAEPAFRLDGFLDGSTGFVDGAEAITVLRISGLRQHYGHQPLAPIAYPQSISGLRSGTPSLRITARVRDAGPPIAQVHLALSPGLSFNPAAISAIRVNGRFPGVDRIGLNNGILRFFTGLTNTVDIRLPTGTLRATARLKDRSRGKRERPSRGQRATLATISLTDVEGQVTTRRLDLPAHSS